jgi:D-alanyl-D-alanine carboxypeptidase (penicillin-binding protein 5/6)
MKKAIVLLLIGALFLAACEPIGVPLGETEHPLVLEQQEMFNAGNDGSALHEAFPSDEENGRTEPSAPALEPVLVPDPASVSLPSDLIINSGGIYLYNFETDSVVYARNEHMRFPPASIAKIMTMLIVLDVVDDLNKPVEVTWEAFADFESDDLNFDGAATARIEPGQENLTYLDVLFAMMLPSGCEASNILAYNAGGRSIPAFIDMMNAKARELGCLNTHFTNASGLYEEGFYSSAYDMFLITMYAINKHPQFLQISLAPQYEMPPNSEFPAGYIVRNTSGAMWHLHELDYVYGIKTGSIFEYFKNGIRYDGFTTFVSMAVRDGMTFMLVTLDADYYDEDGKRSMYLFSDHAFLYEWVYETFSLEMR